jgi:hypothetical protein
MTSKSARSGIEEKGWIIRNANKAKESTTLRVTACRLGGFCAWIVTEVEIDFAVEVSQGDEIVSGRTMVLRLLSRLRVERIIDALEREAQDSGLPCSWNKRRTSKGPATKKGEHGDWIRVYAQPLPENEKNCCCLSTMLSALSRAVPLRGRRHESGVAQFLAVRPQRAMKIFTLAVMLAASGCSHDDKLSMQSAQAAKQIQSWVQIGTSLTDAQQIMMQHQFTCSVMTNSSFGDLTNADFLFCGRSVPDSKLTPMAIRGWRVALVLSNTTVSGVRVSSDFTGP